ncbi:prephenate dehydratase [Streptococcus mitis]|uniref:Prephenate dehydratase n=1 Tax=Streptococcus mitis TaxID=28037 RepID=A0A081QPJ6_STRMT|nr:prephenate dehydratase [Streptococcus mitis]KEQ44869.1 prephenate dehydratase [Streptococcus mitis]
MKEIAAELMTTEVTLKNSNFDFWNKKIEVNSLLNNKGITVKILTPSKLANDIIEQKLDYLVDKYKQAYSGVTIEKLETVYSKELEKNESEAGVSKSTLFLRLIILGIGSVLLVIFGNIAVYIFNPTINRAGDYEKYGVDFVVKIDNIDNFRNVIQYKNGHKNLLLLATNKKVIDKFSKKYAKVLPPNIVIGNINDIKSILNSDNILFVEEYGITRYKNFEENLQVIKNLNKNVIGVATFRL